MYKYVFIGGWFIHRSRTDYIDPDDGFFDTVVWPYHCDMMKKVKKIPSGKHVEIDGSGTVRIIFY